jgi:hypothetical protein
MDLLAYRSRYRLWVHQYYFFFFFIETHYINRSTITSLMCQKLLLIVNNGQLHMYFKYFIPIRKIRW